MTAAIFLTLLCLTLCGAAYVVLRYPPRAPSLEELMKQMRMDLTAFAVEIGTALKPSFEKAARALAAFGAALEAWKLKETRRMWGDAPDIRYLDRSK